MLIHCNSTLHGNPSVPKVFHPPVEHMAVTEQTQTPSKWITVLILFYGERKWENTYPN